MKLSKEFYEPEIICGYEVTSQMKKVWAVELDMLEKFIEVCERNNFNYFLDGGTLLGAVRHKGFIPWDDDIDIIMPRKDYNKLFEIADKEFTHPYFFQTTLSEEGFFRTHAQLRNSNTTGFIRLDGTKPQINKGIFIDIFVLDNIPNSSIARKRFKKEIERKKKILAFQYDREYEKLNKKDKIFYKLVHMFFKIYPFKKYFDKFNKKTLGKYANKNTRIVSDITLRWRKNEMWEKEWFDGYTYLEFEGIKARVPLFYKDVLSKLFGDYMKFPKKIKGSNNHGKVTFDPDTPYKEYFERQKETDE